MEREITRRAFNKIRKRYIKENPFCLRCGCAAHEAHHIHPIIYGGSNEESNLAPLCSTCHKEWDIWEGMWVQLYGPADFDRLFVIFRSAPSTTFLAMLFIKSFTANIFDPAVERLENLGLLELEINNKLRRIDAE